MPGCAQNKCHQVEMGCNVSGQVKWFCNVVRAGNQQRKGNSPSPQSAEFVASQLDWDVFLYICAAVFSNTLQAYFTSYERSLHARRAVPRVLRRTTVEGSAAGVLTF